VGLGVEFYVAFKFKPDESGEAFVSRAKEVIAAAGFQLTTSVFPDWIRY
jgi:hypothetical protein